MNRHVAVIFAFSVNLSLASVAFSETLASLNSQLIDADTTLSNKTNLEIIERNDRSSSQQLCKARFPIRLGNPCTVSQLGFYYCEEMP